MNSKIILIFSLLIFQNSYAQLNLDLLGQLEYEETEINDVWAWVASNGDEYALVGAHTGLSIVNVTQPDQPEEVAFIDDVNSIWRDIKTWGNFAYVTNETGGGIMVVDLSNLPNEVEVFHWAPLIPNVGIFDACHNIFIDEFGVAYLAGCDLNNGGLFYLNVDTEDGMPEYLGKGPLNYSHDVYVRDNIAYASEIYIGAITIYDVSDKNNTVLLGRESTPSNFTHNAWPSDDSQHLFVTDERANSPITSYDISDPTDIQELDQFRALSTFGEGAIPHNVHVLGDYIIASYYTEGCIIIDASHPDNLIEVGNFDTWLMEIGGYHGAWGAYPYLPSGNILISDQTSGLFVLSPTYQQAAYLMGNVINSEDQSPIPSATVRILTTPTFANCDFNGQFKTGYHQGGAFAIEASAPGFESVQLQVDLLNQEITEVTIELNPLPTYSITATIIDEASGLPIPGARITISSQINEHSGTTDASGKVVLNDLLADTYQVVWGKWGYASRSIGEQELNEMNNSLPLELKASLEDNFSIDLGWEVDGTSNGDWEIAEPVGFFLQNLGIYISPASDAADDQGQRAFVTDNGPELFANSVQGKTVLTSPVFDLTSYSDPIISFSTWFFSGDPFSGDIGDDELIITIFDGINEIDALTISLPDFYFSTWNNHEIRLNDFLNPTSTMQLTVSVSAVDALVVEAGFDNFKVTDADASAQNNLTDPLPYIEVSPNPSNHSFRINAELKDARQGLLTIYTVHGHQVIQREIHNLESLLLGEEWLPGVYLAHLSIEGHQVSTTRLVKN